MDTITQVKKRITEFSELYARMDRSVKYLYPEEFPYELTLFGSNTKMKKSSTISVTTNAGAVYVDAIAKSLMDGVWQTTLDGKISARQSTAVKGFADDVLAQIDELLLSEKGISSLNSWNAYHVCTRSIVIGRYINTVGEEGFELDYEPFDARWTPFVFGRGGLRWVAPITTLSKAELVEEYEKKPGVDLAVLKGLSDKGDKERLDHWDGEKNEVYIGTGLSGNSKSGTSGQLLLKQPNPFGKPPFVVVGVTAGFMLRDKGYLKNEYEDLLQFVRHLLDEHSRDMSIKKTIGMDIAVPRYERPVKNPDGKPSKPIPNSDASDDLPEGELHQLLPRPDLNRGFISGDQDISREIQMGSISDAELADVNVNRTALWLATQARIRSTRMRPRMEALETFREQLLRLAIYQLIKMGKGKSELLIGKTGRKSTYSIDKLGDPDKYSIQCKLMSKSKEEEIANIAEASAARGAGIPQSIIDRDIMMAEDPEEWERLRQLQAAREADPAIGLVEMGIQYAREAETLEDEKEKRLKNYQSMLLIERAVSIIKLRQQPPVPEQLPEKATVPTVEQPKGGGGNAMASFVAQGGKGGGNGGQPAQPDLV